jgi:hypothetical protein
MVYKTLGSLNKHPYPSKPKTVFVDASPAASASQGSETADVPVIYSVNRRGMQAAAVLR